MIDWTNIWWPEEEEGGGLVNKIRKKLHYCKRFHVCKKLKIF